MSILFQSTQFSNEIDGLRQEWVGAAGSSGGGLDGQAVGMLKDLLARHEAMAEQLRLQVREGFRVEG